MQRATGRTEELIARGTVTVVPDEFFETLLESLERPPKRSEALVRRARKPRRVTPR